MSVDFAAETFLFVNCIFDHLMSFSSAIFDCFEPFVIFWPLDVVLAISLVLADCLDTQ